MWRAALMVACLSPLVACVDLGFSGQTSGNVGAVWNTQGGVGGYGGAPTLQWQPAGSGTPGTFGVQGYDERTYSSPTNYYPNVTQQTDPLWPNRNDPLMTQTGSSLIVNPERNVQSAFNQARAAASNPGGGGGGWFGGGGGTTIGTYTLIRMGASLSKNARANSRYAANLNLGAIPATNRSGDTLTTGGAPSLNPPAGRLAKCNLTATTQGPVESRWVGGPNTTYTDAANYFVTDAQATSNAYSLCGVGHWFNNNYKYWTVIYATGGSTN
jgi:hypothetical protein